MQKTLNVSMVTINCEEKTVDVNAQSFLMPKLLIEVPLESNSECMVLV